MKRIDQAVYTTDGGTTLLEVNGARTACVHSQQFNAEHLRELARACLSAAELLESRAKPQNGEHTESAA